MEAGGLSYVAATRARQRLPLLALANPDEQGAAREPNKRSLLAKIWWQAQPHFGPAPADLPTEAEREPILDLLRRPPADFKSPATPTSAKWPPPDEGSQEEGSEFSCASPTTQHVWACVHC